MIIRSVRKENWIRICRDRIRKISDALGAEGVAVYTAIASFRNESASIGAIADMLGCSQETVRSQVEQLCDLGVVGHEEEE